VSAEGPDVPAAAAAAPARARTGFRWPAIPARYLSSGLITLILVVGQAFYDIVGGYERLALALGTAVLAELVLGRLLRGTWPVLLSAYISGNSVAILTKPAGGLLWPFWLGALIAISSKYVLTFRNRHLWNPTNFSICALLLLAPHSMAVLSHQWGNDQAIVYVLLAVGTLVVWRAKLLHITASYVAAFIVLAAVRAAIFGTLAEYAGYAYGARFLTEVAPLTGAMYMLLIFFMITDPRTVVGTVRGRVLVTLLIALVEFLIRLLPIAPFRGLDVLLTAPPLFALFLVGPLAMWLDLRRHAPAPAASQPAPSPAKA
jgi:enediyne biosynthesis protein E5